MVSILTCLTAKYWRHLFVCALFCKLPVYFLCLNIYWECCLFLVDLRSPLHSKNQPLTVLDIVNDFSHSCLVHRPSEVLSHFSSPPNPIVV
jgi:hypothetical protein